MRSTTAADPAPRRSARPGPRRRPRPLAAVATVLWLSALAAAGFATTVALVPRALPTGEGTPRRLTIPPFEVPGDDSFFVYTVKDELSQMVLWHDLGSSIENARRADLLFVGNSRLPFGLREEVVVPAAAELGLTAFSIACGHSENVSFALDLIRRHDLRPRVVVVNGGPHVFSTGLSGPARAAREMTRWEAWKSWLESRWTWSTQVALHRRLPKVDLFGQDVSSPWIYYRSEETGWWREARVPNGRHPVGIREEADSYERYLGKATELAAELEQRGSLLVLTTVPYGDTRTGHLTYLEKELGLPWVLPSFDGLTTSDGSHLDRESGAAFSRDFWERFVSHPAVVEQLSLTEPPQDDVPHRNVLKWSTASEHDNFGFDVYRAESRDGPFERILDEPILGAGSSDEILDYRFEDEAIDPARGYFYYVEAIAMDGSRRRFTPLRETAPKRRPVETESP